MNTVDIFASVMIEVYKREKGSHPGLWKEARCLLKIGADSEKFLKQVDHSITIAKLKYPKETHSLMFLFDQSSGHTHCLCQECFKR